MQILSNKTLVLFPKEMYKIINPLCFYTLLQETHTISIAYERYIYSTFQLACCINKQILTFLLMIKTTDLYHPERFMPFCTFAL